MLSEKLRHLVIQQNEARPVWAKHDTPPIVRGFIFTEYQELLEAIEFDKPAVEVASEVGDIFYLLIKYTFMGGSIDPELQNILDQANEVCALTGLDPNLCVLQKVVRNDLKYPQTALSNGLPYEVAVPIVKNIWQQMGGDAQFSHAYLEIAEDLAKKWGITASSEAV